MLTNSANSTKSGNRTICQPGTKPYQAMSKIRMAKLIRKSTSATTVVAMGTTMRGKYTLPIRLALATMLLDASLNTDEKRYQGNIPANTIRAYGAAPSLGSFANLPKTTVKTTIVRKGRKIAQATPM